MNHQQQRQRQEETRRLIAECPCENGCPGCVGPVGNTGPLAKVAALRILDHVERIGEGAAPTGDATGYEEICLNAPSGGDDEVVPF